MSEAETLVLGRQPIFDTRQRLWGYELFCVPVAGAAQVADPLVSLVAGSYVGLQELSEQGRRLVIRLQEKEVLEHFPYALPPATGVLKLPAATPAEPATLEQLAQLRHDGYLLAVDGYSGQPQEEPLVQLADLLCLDSAGALLESLIRSARKRQVLLLATDVTDRARLERCRELGFDLFQGSFYKAPAAVAVRSLSSNHVARLRLLEILEDPDPDFARLAETIQTDAGLTYRLLAYLNSAAFGLRQNIRSVRQAVALLGWRWTRNWLRVALLRGLSQSPETAELVRLSAQRGRFLEGLGERFDYWGFQPDTLQLVGLFSLLDAILGTPMTEVVRYLPVDEKIKTALCQDTRNEYTPWLRLAELLEEDRLGEARDLIQRLGLDEETVLAVFRSAVAWANEFSAVRDTPPA
ncbi:MAG: HDOD domain-containing protein [Acidobacteriota bacterium]